VIPTVEQVTVTSIDSALTVEMIELVRASHAPTDFNQRHAAFEIK
jgi:hypothetical protein